MAEESQIQNELSQLTKQTNSVANMIRHKIKNLQTQHMGADPRLRAVHYARLSKLFTDALVRYREMQNSYAVKQKEKVKRQIRIVEPTITEESLEKIMESSDEPRKMFEHKLRTHRHVAALDEVEDRHQALLKLSQSIQEIQELFSDMQQFTERQEAVLAQIDKHLGDGNAYLTDGNSEMKDAAAITRANRRKMAIILACLFLIIVVAGVLVFVYVVQPNLPKNNGSIPPTATSTPLADDKPASDAS